MHPSVSEVTLGAAVFLGSSQNHPLASLSGNRGSTSYLLSFSSVCVGKARSMWNTVPTILVFGEYWKYTEY